MKPEDVRAFVERRWDALADLKLRFLVDRYRREGADGARRAARRLAEHWARVRPAAESDDSRAKDLSNHVALKARLDRASRAFRRR